MFYLERKITERVFHIKSWTTEFCQVAKFIPLHQCHSMLVSKEYIFPKFLINLDTKSAVADGSRI